MAQVNASALQGKAEDVDDAKETVAMINDVYDHKTLAYVDIAKAQVKAGNIADARKTLYQAKEAAVMISKGAPRAYHSGIPKIDAYMSIARVQAVAGDVAEAKETAALISEDSYKQQTYGDIAAIQANAGDMAGAKETAALISDNY